MPRRMRISKEDRKDVRIVRLSRAVETANPSSLELWEGENNHATSSWNDKCLNFFTNKAEDEGDVTFVVGPQKEEMKAFKLLLRISSPVFDTQFSSTWDTSNPIHIPDVDPKIFRLFLKLILKDKICMDYLAGLMFNLEEVFNILYTSKKYDVTHISKGIISYIYTEKLTRDNAIFIYEKIDAFGDDPEVSKRFFLYIESHLSDIIKNGEAYWGAANETFKLILQSDNVIVSELDLFEAVNDWASVKCLQEDLELTGENLRKILGDLLYLIRFPLMSRKEFVESVMSRKILTSDEALSVLVYITTPLEERTLEQEENLLFKIHRRKLLRTCTSGFSHLLINQISSQF